MNIISLISAEVNIPEKKINSAIALREEGGTIPFIARYRKERTGNLDENQLREIFDMHEYYKELEERKETVLKSIEEQGKMTDALRKKILECTKKNELEDLYLPFKPKRRTKAIIAIEKGLKPLSELIENANISESPINLKQAAEKFISEENGIKSAEEALAGASDIIAEQIAETADIRAAIRELMFREGIFTSKIKSKFKDEETKYDNYRDFEVPVKSISPHAMLAMRRGEKEGVLSIDISVDEAKVLSMISDKTLLSSEREIREFYYECINDCFKRLLKSSLSTEIRLDRKKFADEESIRVFEKNLRQILLAAPAGSKPVLAIDPGFRTGCKSVVLDRTGKYLDYRTIFPFNSQREISEAKSYISNMAEKYKIEIIAIGNGTAGREAEEFVKEAVKYLEPAPLVVMVNESGASVYSAGEAANREFPDLDLTVRGAISIGRRLQDPLAELVKIDPKSIGVGQYQHDVDQKLLMKKLGETVESCVNYVGVDLNTASLELLTHVAGISESVAKNIVDFRNKNGEFDSREKLLKVPRFGDKIFEQSAGFLRIRNGKNILDNTGVHPESYEIAMRIISDATGGKNDIRSAAGKLSSIDIRKYIDEKAGEPTIRDIIKELEKPGRDPRDEFRYAKFADDVKEITDLKKGMQLEGVVTNITNFGAFVDIGVHQDGLVHVSEIADSFVQNPADFVKVGQVVKVRVLDVNEKLKRIQLSMKSLSSGSPKGRKSNKNPENFNLNDLKNKFKST